jgi:hypothetical protein
MKASWSSAAQRTITPFEDTGPTADSSLSFVAIDTSDGTAEVIQRAGKAFGAAPPKR